MKIAIRVWLVLAVSAAPAFAQGQEPVDGSAFEQKSNELAQWLNEYQAWEKWFELWGNRVAHNFENQPIWERKKRPGPPAWLEAECQGDFVAYGPMADACYLVRHWDEQPLLILQRRGSSLATTGGRVDDEVAKSSFFRRVHLTGLWMEARYPATPAYGIVGMQVGVFEAGRFTLPAVGLMVVVIPDSHGGRAWKAATTVGVGYRLCDFAPPLLRTQASLHLNFARTSVLGVQAEPIPHGMGNVNLFGLSVSARRRR